MDQQLSRQEISGTTGGEMLGLGERFDGVQRRGERLEAYYSLGFDAAPFADGRKRLLEVQVRQPGFECALAGCRSQRRTNSCPVTPQEV